MSSKVRVYASDWLNYFRAKAVCVLMKRAFFGLLGAFAKLRKTNISFVMSVRPSVCLSAWNNSAPTGRTVMKLDTE